MKLQWKVFYLKSVLPERMTLVTTNTGKEYVNVKKTYIS